jgi:thymidine kinase
MSKVMQRDPEFVVFTGPMFGSKTSKLLAAIERYKYQSRGVRVFKPKMDSRYEDQRIVTHTGLSVPASCVSHGREVIDAVLSDPDCDVVAIDEAFMIDGSAEACLALFRRGRTIVVSSIQLSASGIPFDEVRDMMPYATRIEVCPAVCPITGRDAYYTERKRSDLGEIAVGGKELYSPVCWEHAKFMRGA